MAPLSGPRLGIALLLLAVVSGCRASREVSSDIPVTSAPDSTIATASDTSTTALVSTTVTESSTSTLSVATTIDPDTPAACTREAAEALIGEFFEALGQGDTGLTERFFNPAEGFFLYLDPDRGESQMHERAGLDAHFAELQSQGIRLELLAVDLYSYQTENPEGIETGTILFWIHRDGASGPGIGKASVDCTTGLFERLAISEWAVPQLNDPPWPCSRDGEILLADFFVALSTGEQNLAERFFNPPAIFELYRDLFRPVDQWHEVSSLDSHLTSLQESALQVRLAEVVNDFFFTWSAGERQVNLLTFTLQDEGKVVLGEGTSTIDCETGLFHYMSIDSWG